MTEEDLAAEDYDSITTAGRTLFERGWRKEFSLNEALDMWAALVKEVERGYTLTVDDYGNDLCIRGWLEEARPMLTKRVSSAMDERLSHIDARFREATVATSRPMGGAPDEWWGRRLPKILVGELAEDADRMQLRG